MNKQNGYGLEAIRAGLSNYIGSCIAALPESEGVSRNRLVISILAEEALHASQVKPKYPCDLTALTPLLKALEFATKQNLQTTFKKDVYTEKDKKLMISMQNFRDAMKAFWEALKAWEEIKS